MIVLVACCAVFLWAGRVVWQSRDPLRVEAIAIQGRALRSLQSRYSPERVAAIHDLAQLDLAENVIAIPPLINFLKRRARGRRRGLDRSRRKCRQERAVRTGCQGFESDR